LATSYATNDTGNRIAQSAEALVRHSLASSVTTNGTDDELYDNRK
jgi:hypothetical protein